MPKSMNEEVTIPDVGGRACEFSQAGDGVVTAAYRVTTTDNRQRHTSFTVAEVVAAWAEDDPEAPAYTASLVALKAANPTVDDAAFAAAVDLVMASMVAYGDGKIGFE